MKTYDTLGEFFFAVATGEETRLTATPEEAARWRQDYGAAVAPQIERIRAEQRQAAFESRLFFVD